MEAYLVFDYEGFLHACDHSSHSALEEAMNNTGLTEDHFEVVLATLTDDVAEFDQATDNPHFRTFESGRYGNISLDNDDYQYAYFL